MLKTNTAIGVDWCVRHCGRERDGFELKRDGLSVYTFWHFFNSVDLLTPDGIVTTKPNACYVCPPHTRQYFLSHGSLLHDWFHFDEKTAEKWLEYGLKFETLYYPEQVGFITDITEKIEMEHYSKNAFFEEYIDSELSELFIGIVRACSTESGHLSNEITELFHKIRFKMLTHIDCDRSVDDLAKEALVSPSYFHAVYKELYGVSPARDLTDNRIKEAKYHLLNSSFSVGEIAELCGFKSPYHFSKQFKKYVGMSPTEFRKRSAGVTEKPK